QWKPLDLFGSADHAPFEQAGIPTGGLWSGATELLDVADAQRFGRTAGRYADPCYHLACDDRSNVDPALMLALAQSLARVTISLLGQCRSRCNPTTRSGPLASSCDRMP